MPWQYWALNCVPLVLFLLGFQTAGVVSFFLLTLVDILLSCGAPTQEYREKITWYLLVDLAVLGWIYYIK
jgi:hypothetical protein